MANHPCIGMSKKAIEVFERIAVGDALPPSPKGVLPKLEAKGLIQRKEDKRLQDELGSFSIPQYFVPLPVHMQWCAWAAETATDLDDA